MTDPQLARRLGLPDAVLIGLGSMIGAGVFSAFAPAAAAAGAGLLIGLASPQRSRTATPPPRRSSRRSTRSREGPTSTAASGSGDWWGFLAGWGFVVGKTASCAAMALTFAAYAVPAPWQRPAAVAAVVTLAAVNYRGVTRTARLTRVIVTVVLLALTSAVVAALREGRPRSSGLVADPGGPGPYEVLQSAGLLFFAFAGYARIATLGEEVRDPGARSRAPSSRPSPSRWRCTPSSR